jgi:hypothetical protein
MEIKDELRLKNELQETYNKDNALEFQQPFQLIAGRKTVYAGSQNQHTLNIVGSTVQAEVRSPATVYNPKVAEQMGPVRHSPVKNQIKMPLEERLMIETVAGFREHESIHGLMGSQNN